MSLTVMSPFSAKFIVDDEELLYPMAMENLARFVECRADRNGDEVVSFVITSEMGRSRRVSKRRSRFVKYPDEPPFFCDGHPRDAELLHLFEGFGDGPLRVDRDRDRRSSRSRSA